MAASSQRGQPCERPGRGPGDTARRRGKTLRRMRRSQKAANASQKDFLLHSMWPPTARARRKLGISVASGEGAADPRPERGAGNQPTGPALSPPLKASSPSKFEQPLATCGIDPSREVQGGSGFLNLPSDSPTASSAFPQPSQPLPSHRVLCPGPLLRLMQPLSRPQDRPCPSARGAAPLTLPLTQWQPICQTMENCLGSWGGR